MRIYLDTCCIQRPLDNKTQIRIILEAEAVGYGNYLVEREELFGHLTLDEIVEDIKRQRKLSDGA